MREKGREGGREKKRGRESGGGERGRERLTKRILRIASQALKMNILDNKTYTGRSFLGAGDI